MPLREVYFTNSKSHKREKLVPLEPGKVKFYSCGPTVYNLIHIGNLRAAMTSDLIFRTLKKFKYDVTYIRNYTDIDDRIIDQMIKEKLTLDAITKKYINEVELDYAAAGLLEPTKKTLVTEHLPEIISLIEDIIKNDCAYEVQGEVFFAIDKFPSYGQLSGRNIQELIAGERVDVNSLKKNPLDFSLWKPAKPGEPTWDSPWGKGRPGWHIECSAMACKHLGPMMDIHHGGDDLIFPHHENEIAQTEAATGKQPYAGLWVHNAMLNLSKEKMSKSLGNVVMARDFLREYGSEVARMILLSSHYRSIIDFNEESLAHALQQLERIYEAKQKAEILAAKSASVPDPKAEEGWGGFLASLQSHREKMAEHMAQDLNTPGLFSEILMLTREWNRILATPRAEVTPAAILAAQELVGLMENDLWNYVGIGRSKAAAALEKISDIRKNQRERGGKKNLSDAEIEGLIVERKEARATKNFTRADEIRKIFTEAAIEILDSPAGTTWKRKD